MTTPHAVISAFLDNEPFDPRELAASLDDPNGRATLIDLVALRHLMSDDAAAWPTPSARRSTRTTWLVAAAAAAIFALTGGYALGHRSGQIAGEQRGLKAAAASDVPPAPTRVIELKWQDTNGGH